MKQLLQNINDGKTVIVEVPIPQPRHGTVIVQTAASLVSSGTERTVVEFAEKNLVGKARSRPDLVRQVLDKARREGILTTLDATLNRLEQPMVLGYSSSGTIVAVGEGVTDFQVGNRVACAGGGYATHAEYNLVPTNLLTRLPDSVDFESAAFTTLGAIALHGFRLAQPQIGERVAVIGLGVLGLLSVGIARAAGCSVFGIDLNPDRIKLGEQMGAVTIARNGAEDAGAEFTQGRGFDTVLICADSQSSDSVNLAGSLARDRGHVIAIGAVGLNIPRKIYYNKEINFIVSRSYGPGRYDPEYEEHGHDYPFGYVRWTEGRNLEAFVDIISNGHIDLKSLITHRFPIENAPEAYDLITGKSNTPFLGVLIEYPQNPKTDISSASLVSVSTKDIQRRHPQNTPGLGVLGAGNYASAIFLPNIKKTGRVNKIGIASASGLKAQIASRRFSFGYASSNEMDILEDQKVDIIAIMTRHDQHARQILESLKRGKHVYCEKPLAVTQDELNEIASILSNEDLPLLTVGFNRRFAPFSIKLRSFLENRCEPLVAHYRVNAGYLPLTHWLHHPQEGGGRIIGEGCHFIDYLSFIIGGVPQTVSAKSMSDGDRYHQDNVVLTFTYADGSIGSVTYLANGDKSVAKERVEVFCGGKVAILDDFRRLELVKNGRRKVHVSYLKQDKGHLAAWTSFLDAIEGNQQLPIPYTHLIGVSQAAITALHALASNLCEPIQPPA